MVWKSFILLSQLYLQLHDCYVCSFIVSVLQLVSYPSGPVNVLLGFERSSLFFSALQDYFTSKVYYQEINSVNEEAQDGGINRVAEISPNHIYF